MTIIKDGLLQQTHTQTEERSEKSLGKFRKTLSQDMITAVCRESIGSAILKIVN